MTTAGIRGLATRSARKIIGRGKTYNVVRSLAIQVLRKRGEPWMDSFTSTYRTLQLRSHAEKEIGREELRQLKEVIRSRNLFRGEKAEQFRREFAELYGTQHAITSTSGTAAIHVGLAMLDPDPGDEIIVPPITDMGTIIPVLYQNAIPVFADIEPNRWTLDPESVERCITPRTRAIVVVHIFGGLADMDAMVDIGRRYGVPIIEDCAQAHLAEYGHRPVGTVGDIGCFSFQQTKQMTTGEGGMTITDNPDYAARARLFVDKGWNRDALGDARQYTMLGTNYRMTELQAAVGLAQIRKIQSIADRRNRNGMLLGELLGKTDGLTTQYIREQDKHAFYSFGFTVNPDAPFTASALVRVLTEQGIPASKNYIGKPIFECSELFSKKQIYGKSHFPFDYPGARQDVPYHAGTCPVAEDILHRLVGISMTERYSERDVIHVADEIKKAVNRLSQHVVQSGWEAPKQGRYKASIIGCGAISRDHAMGYQGLDDTTLVSLADVSQDALKTIASEFSVSRTYTDFHEMLASELPDIVSICTWPGLHAEMAVAAAEHGVKAIFCEKPMSINLAGADKMIQACERRGIKLVIAHQFRFNPHINKAKQLIESGAIGKPELVWGHWDSSLLNRGTHVIDAMRYVLGDPEADWVLGQAVRENDSHNRGHRIEEIAQGLIHFANGTRGLLESGELAQSNFALHIYGSDGQIMARTNSISIQTRQQTEEIQLPEIKEHQASLAEMVAWMDGKAESHRGNATQARKDLEILMAIFESARTRTAVRPPLDAMESPLDLMFERRD